MSPAVLIATGAHCRRLDVPGLERFEGISVHHAATESEIRICRGDPVAVAGGGKSAGQAAVGLSAAPGLMLEVRILMANGCFDVLHADHVRNLEDAG